MAVWDIAFDSDHRPVLLSFKIRFHKRSRRVPLQPKIDMAGLKDDECKRKFRQHVPIHVGVRTRKKLSDADSFTKRKLRRQLQQDGDNEWTSRAMEFEKAWEDRNPRKAYALLKQYSGKMKDVPMSSALLMGPTYAVNEEPPTESEVLVCIQKMKNGKSGGDDGISAEMLKYLPPSGIRIIEESVCCVLLAQERIITDRLIKHREETTRDEQAGLRPGPSTIDHVFIVRRVIEIWQRYSKPMQLAFLDFEAAFDSPHRGRILNALRADGVPGKFVHLLDDMNQRTTAAVRTPVGCTTPFEVVTGVRQGAVAGPFLFNFAIDYIMRRTVDQFPADIVLAPSGCPLTDLEYADDVVIFAESSTKLQHVVNLASKLAAAYGPRLRPDKCGYGINQMWISSNLGNQGRRTTDRTRR
ncbi:hypothetical protein RB195_010461 [Necator americanus]|uniref:Reverse transcriptase domain-containing protein n=1 Tax=Necator americanus TaxID=51031 RepID=A0ABR1CY11_NECAM